jgi:zinc protease
MYFNRPESALDWTLVGTAFLAHGYKHDTIGIKSDIESYRLEDLQSFYDRYYWPHNATLIIAGPHSAAESLRAVRETIGRITPAQPSITHRETREPEQTGLRRASLHRDTPLKTLIMAHKAPPATDRDWTVLDVLLTTLTAGETSPLYERLVRAKLASTVEPGLTPSRHPYLATLTVSLTEKATYERVEAVLNHTLAEVATSGLPAATVRLTARYLHHQSLLGRDSDSRIASQLCEWISAGNWQLYYDTIEWLETITTADIRRVAAQYLTERTRTVATLIPTA